MYPGICQNLIQGLSVLDHKYGPRFDTGDHCLRSLLSDTSIRHFVQCLYHLFASRSKTKDKAIIHAQFQSLSHHFVYLSCRPWKLCELRPDMIDKSREIFWEFFFVSVDQQIDVLTDCTLDCIHSWHPVIWLFYQGRILICQQLLKLRHPCIQSFLKVLHFMLISIPGNWVRIRLWITLAEHQRTSLLIGISYV